MEQHSVLFRSRKIRTYTTWGASWIKKRWRGTDVLDIWPYSPWDDIRDISWIHTAKHNTIEKKIREEESNFEVILVDLIGEERNFTIDTNPSVSEYRNTLIEILQSSARQYHFPYRQLRNTKELQIIKNSMVIVLYWLRDTLSQELIWWLAHSNDIVPIELVHPYELNPTRWPILEWYWVDIHSYRESVERVHDSHKKLFAKHWVQWIILQTDMPLVLTLNQYFKNRIS